MKPTTNQVREWAREAGILVPGYRDHIEHMERFAELVYTAGRMDGLDRAAELAGNCDPRANNKGIATAIRLLKDDNGTN